MRFLTICCSFLMSWPSIALAQAPDASPTTPVETVVLENFESSREEAVLEAYIDGIVAAHMRQHETPGVVLSVVRDGRLMFAKGYGFADAPAKAPVNAEETMFRIGSVSKTFIWASVMMLAERGAVDLNEDVNTYLDGVTIPEAFDAPVTLNHLMAHRAGFEDTFGVFTAADDTDETLTELLNEHMPKRVFPPGARTSYSNWGSALAAKIVEDVSGVSFEQFVETEIFAPLGMAKTTLKGPENMPPDFRQRLATGHKLAGGAAVETDYMEIGPFAPAGAIASTATDMAQWMQVLLRGGAYEGGRLYSEETARAMWSRAFNDREAGSDLAHGFFSKTYRGKSAFGHGGATSAFFSYMMLAPDYDIGVFVSQNATNDRGLANDMPDLIIERLVADEGAPASVQAVTGDTDDATALAGLYHNNRRSFTTFVKLFSTDATTTIEAVDGAIVMHRGDKATRLEPVRGAKDAFEDKFGNRIVFGRDDNGKGVFFAGPVGVHTFERTGWLGSPDTLNLALGAAILFSLTTALGAWRRWGHKQSQRPAGAALNIFGFVAAGAVFAFLGLTAAVIAGLSNASASDLLQFPPPVISWMRIAGLLVFVVAGIGIAGLAPAWASSGWSIARKLHFTALALSLAALAVMLVHWNVVFAPVI